jgi:hypothetical protein
VSEVWHLDPIKAVWKDRLTINMAMRMLDQVCFGQMWWSRNSNDQTKAQPDHAQSTRNMHKVLDRSRFRPLRRGKTMNRRCVWNWHFENSEAEGVNYGARTDTVDSFRLKRCMHWMSVTKEAGLH